MYNFCFLNLLGESGKLVFLHSHALVIVVVVNFPSCQHIRNVGKSPSAATGLHTGDYGDALPCRLEGKSVGFEHFHDVYVSYFLPLRTQFAFFSEFSGSFKYSNNLTFNSKSSIFALAFLSSAFACLASLRAS